MDPVIYTQQPKTVAHTSEQQSRELSGKINLRFVVEIVLQALFKGQNY